MTVCGLIQAHYVGWDGAKDRSLMKLDGKLVVEHVIARLREMPMVDRIVLAVPDCKQNKILKPDQIDISAQITKMISDREQAAYIRGWEDAVATMMGAADKSHPKQPESKKTPFTAAVIEKKARGKKRKTRKHVLRNEGPSKARAVVFQAIKENPGRTGAQIAEVVSSKVNRNTVRTQIRKLRMAEQIEQDSELRWYEMGVLKLVA